MNVCVIVTLILCFSFDLLILRTLNLGTQYFIALVLLFSGE